MPTLNSLGKTTLATIIITVALVVVALIFLVPSYHSIVSAETTTSNYFTITIKNVPPLYINNSGKSYTMEVSITPSSTVAQVAPYYYVEIAVVFTNETKSAKATIKAINPSEGEFEACANLTELKIVSGKFPLECVRFKITGPTRFYQTTNGSYIQSQPVGSQSIASFNIEIENINSTAGMDIVYFEIYALPATTNNYYLSRIPYTTLKMITILVISPSNLRYELESPNIESECNATKGWVNYTITPSIEELEVLHKLENSTFMEWLYKVCIYEGNGVSTNNFPVNSTKGMNVTFCAFRKGEEAGPYMVQSVKIKVSLYAGSTLINSTVFECKWKVEKSGNSYKFSCEPSGHLLINTTKLAENKLEALEEHPNATIVVSVSDPYGISYSTGPGENEWYSVLALKTPKVVAVSVKANRVTATKMGGVYYISASAQKITVNLNISAYAAMYHDKAAKVWDIFTISKSGLKVVGSASDKVIDLCSNYPYEIYSNTTTAIAKLFSVIVYVNGTPVQTEISRKIINLTEVDLSGIQYYNISIGPIDVSNVKYRTNITIVLKESSGYGRTFKITIFVARETTPPSAPTFTLIKEGNFTVGITDLSAEDKIGIAKWNLTLVTPSYSVNFTIPVEVLNAKYFTLYYVNSSLGVDHMNYTDCLVNPSQDCVYAIGNASENGGMLVGYGKIFVLPPVSSPTCTVKIVAINYGGIGGPAKSVEISYGEGSYSMYYIMYLVPGWNIFALPGAVTDTWGKVFYNIVKDMYLSNKITALWCANTGPLTSVGECAKILATPTPVSVGVLKPYVFFMYVSTSEPQVYVIPVMFKIMVPTPTPLMISVITKPGVWNAIPIALSYGGEIDSILVVAPERYGIPVTFYVYRPLTTAKIVGVGSVKASTTGPSWTGAKIVLPGEIALATSPIGATIQITPPS